MAQDRLTPERQLHFRNHHVPLSSYRGYKVSADRERMLVLLAPPEKPLKVMGAEQVEAALAEIFAATDPDDEARGWNVAYG